MRKLIFLMGCLVLGGCSLFHETPQKVVDGQRAVYQGLLVAEDNTRKIVQRYIEDCRALVTYHVEFIWEPRIDAIRKNPDLSREEKSLQISLLEQERQARLSEAFTKIDKVAEQMQTMALKNHELTKKLVESIYNYMSTSPINVDNISFFIKQLEEVRRGSGSDQ